MRSTHIDSALAASALATVLLSVLAEASPTTFQRTYGGPGEDMGSCARQTADGGYIVTGGYDVFSDSGVGYLVRTDAYGDTVWTRRFGGAWVEQTPDSGFVVVGGVDSGICLVKTDAGGDTLWKRIYPGNNAASMVEQTADGGFVMAGTASYSSPSGGDVYIIKTDAGGETLWTRTYGGPDDDEGNSIRQTSDGGYIIAAFTRSFGQTIWLIRTDSIGDTLWTRAFGGDSFSFSAWAQQTMDGGYFVAGWTWSYSPSPQTYLVKTNSTGDTLWTRTIGGLGWSEGRSGQQVSDGGYVVVGTFEDTTGDIDVLLVRTDAGGDTLWTRTIGGTSFDLGLSVQQTADGGYVICGETYSFGAGEADFYLVKTDENGRLAVAEPKARPARKSGYSLTCEPNPFHSSTVLRLTAEPPGLSDTHLRIYDVQGRLVRTLAVSRESQTIWDGKDDGGRLLASGTYLVRCCDVAGRHATTRLVLQR